MILLIALAILLTFGCWRWFRFTVCNLAHIIIHPWRIKRGKRRLKAIGQIIADLSCFDTWIETVFRYKSDWIDYASWLLVFAMKWDKKDPKKKWRGDCDDVASLAWYWAKRKNLHASYVSIIRPNHQVGHAVCLIEDGGVWKMVDSHGVVEFMGWDVHYPGCKIIIRKKK